MRFLYFAVAALGLTASAASAFNVEISEQEYTYQFAKFQVAYNKSYSRAEYVQKYNVFKTNYDQIVNHNAQGKSWTLAVNEYADMTWEEFKATKLGYKKVVVDGIPRRTVNLHGLVTIPDSVDWRAKNVVTPVKNQGGCGACWAFSTTGSVEGAVAIKTGTLTSLSEQQLVDCSAAEGNQGCGGGLMDQGFEFVIKNNGICAESAYPYTGQDGPSCQTSCSSVSHISSYTDVTANSEDALKAAVAQQPVSVAIEADQSGFQFYSSGVFDGECGTSLDHGVLAVGYGTDSSSNKDFWLVKNSWGANWGDQGYIRLVRKSGSGNPGQCGIAMDASFPVA